MATLHMGHMPLLPCRSTRYIGMSLLRQQEGGQSSEKQEQLKAALVVC